MTEATQPDRRSGRPIERPPSPRRDLDAYESERSIEPFTQRDLMLDLGAFFFVLIGIQALGAGTLTDDPISDFQWWARLVIAGLAIGFAVLQLTWFRGLDDERTQWGVVACATAALAVEFFLSFYGPGSVAAMYVAFVAAAMFSAQFFSRNAAIGQVALITALSIAGVVVNYGDPDVPHVLARIVGLLPVIWIISIAVWALRHDRRRALDEAERYAFSDPLTGLANLRALKLRADDLLAARNERINRPVGVVVLDLDGFRGANVLHGYADGDRLLRSIATTLTAELPPGHTVARTGSDEFMVLIENVNPAALEAIGALYRERVLATIDADHRRLAGIDASVGTAASARDGVTLEELVRTADREMYRVKAEHERQPGARGDALPIEPAQLPGPAAASASPTPVDWRRTLAWGPRPLQVKFVSASWLFATIGMIAAALMPDAEVTHPLIVAFVAVAAIVYGIARYFTPPATQPWQQVLEAMFSTFAIAAVTYSTGGAGSPAWPIILLTIVYIGWFMPLRLIFPMVLAALAVLMVPMITDDSIPLVESVALFGGIGVSVALTLVTYYNHFYLLRAREITRRLAAVDPRTGTYNRREFERRVQDELDMLGYGDIDALAIVMLDLGDFKSVSANYGRAIGDRMLTEVAQALEAASRPEDCVARLGGDEFAVVLPGVNADTARELATRFVKAVAEQLVESNLPSNRAVQPSAGFALYGMHGRTLERLMTAADVALTAAKTSGRDTVRVSSYVVSL